MHQESITTFATLIALTFAFDAGIYAFKVGYRHARCARTCHVSHGSTRSLTRSPTNSPTVQGSEAAFDFLTAYFVEDSLSVDNLFVFLLLFRYFKAPT